MSDCTTILQMTLLSSQLKMYWNSLQFRQYIKHWSTHGTLHRYTNACWFVYIMIWNTLDFGNRWSDFSRFYYFCKIICTGITAIWKYLAHLYFLVIWYTKSEWFVLVSKEKWSNWNINNDIQYSLWNQLQSKINWQDKFNTVTGTYIIIPNKDPWNRYFVTGWRANRNSIPGSYG